MASRRGEPLPSEPGPPSRRPTTPKGMEDHLISLAADLAEKRLIAGTATAAEVVHFLKLGSSREKLEQQRLHYENALTQAKIDAIKANEGIEALFQNAIDAMRSYSGQAAPERRDDDED